MPTQKVNGIDLHYECSGSGEPLLFIHGLGSSGRDWEEQTAHFAADYQLITVDCRGHGRSEKPAGPYSVPLFATDIAQLLDTLKLSPVHVVGVSMGGMIAFQLAADRPDLVHSMTIVNSGPEMILHTFKEKFAIWQRLIIVRLMGMRKMGEVLADRLFPDPGHAPLRAQFADRWAENDKRAYLDSLKGLLGWSVSNQLPNIQCPTLVIASDQDYTPLSLKEAYMPKLANGELVVIENAHHAVPAERPEQFNKILERFLNQQPMRETANEQHNSTRA